MRNRMAWIITSLICSVAWGQSPGASSGQMQSMDMPTNHDMSNMKDMPMGDKDEAATAHVMHSMEGHMDMGPHMKMTALRQAKAGDRERAATIVDAARKASAKYM